MKPYHRWTKEEDEIIKHYIKNNPTNIKEALKEVAHKLDMNWQAVRTHYYRSIQKKKNDKIFLTVSSKKVASNYKVTRNGKRATSYQPEKIKKSIWKRIIETIFK